MTILLIVTLLVWTAAILIAPGQLLFTVATFMLALATGFGPTE